MILGFVSQTLVIKAKAHTRVTQILAGIGWTKSQIYVDATEIFIGRGKNITLVPEGKWGVGVTKASNSNGMETLVCSREQEIKMGPYVKDYRGG